MTLTGIEQMDFGGGIFRGRQGPGDAVFDAVNALVSDERGLYRRGGAAYAGAADVSGDFVSGLWDGHVSAGRRTAFWSSSNGFWVLSDDGASADDVGFGALSGIAFRPRGRPAALGGMVAFPAVDTSPKVMPVAVVYAGSRELADSSAGTVTVTNGSATVTSVGAGFLTNADPGRFLRVGSVVGLVKSVESNTSLTLIAAWTGPTAAGTAYTISTWRVVDTAALSPYHVGEEECFLTAVGTVPRLLLAVKGRVYFTEPGALTFAAENYHELPEGSRITGATALEDTAVVFTTGGVWAISNMNFDPLDDFGNVQHQVQKINGDVILWGDPGVAAWGGALLVPALDDVYVVGMGGAPVSVSEAIRPLYRGYVEAGCQPGQVAVYRAHMFLPILLGTDIQDVLVCRLDLRDSRGNARPAWTRWGGQAASRVYAVRVGAESREPKLLGIRIGRVTDLTGCFDPEAGNDDDADGSDHELVVVTRDFASGAIDHTFALAKVGLELVDGGGTIPSFEVEHAAGPVETETWVSAGVRGEGDGERAETFRFARRARAVRLRITTSGAAARAVLRSIEVRFRERGRS